MLYFSVNVNKRLLFYHNFTGNYILIDMKRVENLRNYILNDTNAVEFNTVVTNVHML